MCSILFYDCHFVKQVYAEWSLIKRKGKKQWLEV